LPGPLKPNNALGLCVQRRPYCLYINHFSSYPSLISFAFCCNARLRQVIQKSLRKCKLVCCPPIYSWKNSVWQIGPNKECNCASLAQDCLDDVFLTRDVTIFRRVGIYKDTCYVLLILSLPLMATTRPRRGSWIPHKTAGPKEQVKVNVLKVESQDNHHETVSKRARRRRARGRKAFKEEEVEVALVDGGNDEVSQSKFEATGEWDLSSSSYIADRHGRPCKGRVYPCQGRSCGTKNRRLLEGSPSQDSEEATRRERRSGTGEYFRCSLTSLCYDSYYFQNLPPRTCHKSVEKLWRGWERKRKRNNWYVFLSSTFKLSFLETLPGGS
jgi:hypothetical protein